MYESFLFIAIIYLSRNDYFKNTHTKKPSHFLICERKIFNNQMGLKHLNVLRWPLLCIKYTKTLN